MKYIDDDYDIDNSEMSGKEFRRIRRKAGLSIAKAARILGIDPRTVTRYEAGVFPVSTPVAIAMRLIKNNSSKGI